MRKNKTIFLVDDDQDDQEFFKEALMDIDSTINLNLAVNGKDAIYKLNNMNKLPDLIFMDINMPLMDGLECLKQLKGIEQFKNIPVILLSASLNDSKSQYALSLAASSLLIKPSDVKILKTGIVDMLRIFLPSPVMA